MAKEDEKKINNLSDEKGDKPSKSKKIEVDVDILSEIMKQIEKLKEDNKKLIAVADLGRIDKYNRENNSKDIVHTAKMRFYEGKPVTGWKLLQDDVYRDSNGIHHEIQQVELFFSNGDSQKINYKESELNVEKKDGEIIHKKKDEKGNEVVTLRLKDGQEFELDIRFLN